MHSCLVNGEVSPYIPADDRGLAYGDGLFETLVVSQGEPRFWQAHMDRLAAGCDILGLKAPPQEVLLRETLTAAAGLSPCVVKIILTRGAGGRGYRPVGGSGPNRVVSSHAMPDGIRTAQLQGIRLATCALRLGFQPALRGIKHLNRLEQVLASRELEQRPGLEGLVLDEAGYVNSVLSGNLFLVAEGRLLTPRMDRCGVHGVTRALILRDFAERCELRRVHPDMLREADEVFVTNVVRGILPVVEIDGRDYEDGPVTRELQRWFGQLAGPQ